jgi:2-dehydro-3-deoxy-L-rhamnonate dehydrogenase (NAD+)
MQSKTIVITGAGSGIGAGIARKVAQAGDRAVLWDLSDGAQAIAQSIGAGAFAVQCDVTDPSSVTQALRATIARTATIEGLVCSAGITGPNGPLVDYDLSAWKQVFEVNVHGLMLCNQAVARQMLTAKKGRIVNIASVAGKEGNPNASAYSASKAAVIGLTKSLGKELAKTSICVNCITPAAVHTPIFEQMTQQHIDFMLSKIPMGRFGEIEEIANLAMWLLSDQCSFSTGAVFDCSGGRATY